jgi:hypothetical protein
VGTLNVKELVRQHWNRRAAPLPLFGGRPEAEMVALVSAHGFAPVSVEPVMDHELWIELPEHPRYLVTARA